eukprot:gene1280-1621_t
MQLVRQKASGLDIDWSITPRHSKQLSCRAGSLAGSGRDDGVFEIIAQHEQLLTALGEKVATLEDDLERLQQDVIPALNLVSAVQAHAMHQQDTAADLPAHQHQQLPGAVPSQHGVNQVDQAVTKVLADLAQCTGLGGAASFRDRAGLLDKDDYCSVRSFCTSISYGSTQISGPALVTDLRPAAKAPSRAPQQYLQQQQNMVQLSWPGRMDLITAAQSGGRSAGDALCDQQQQQGQEAPQQLDLQRQTISQLALHAERDEEVRQQLCTPELLEVVTDMLQAAAHLVWYISRSDTLRTHLQQQHQLLPVLLDLLVSQDAASARAAAFALNNLAMDPACRYSMVDAGAVPRLIDMLNGCDSLGQESAASALMMLASEEASIRAMIVACNGVQALVSVLRYGGPAAQEAAASALENLSLDAACELALAEEGAVEGLLQVLKDGTSGTQAAAAGALRNLAVNEQLSEDCLLRAGAVPVLLELVGNTKLDVGGAAVLVDAARSLPSATARSAALGALLVLSMDDNHRRAMAGAGAAGVLVHAALSGSPLSKEYAARSIANLATSDTNMLELLKEGAATVLAHLLKSQVSGLIASGAAAKPPDQPAPAATATPGCCLAAARALQNLAKCRSGFRQLLDAGCIPALVSALSFPGPISTAAVSALCYLCISNRALQELVNGGGVSKLVQGVAKNRHLTPRGQRQGVRLLKRLVRGNSSCSAMVKEEVAALGMMLA